MMREDHAFDCRSLIERLRFPNKSKLAQLMPERFFEVVERIVPVATSESWNNHHFISMTSVAKRP
jgi:hypothetical protein